MFQPIKRKGKILKLTFERVQNCKNSRLLLFPSPEYPVHIVAIPHRRRTEWAKIKISHSDFSILLFGKISRDFKLKFVEYKHGRNVQNFHIILDHRRIGIKLQFIAKYCFIKFLLVERQLIHFNNWLSAVFVFGYSPMRIDPEQIQAMEVNLTIDWNFLVFRQTKLFKFWSGLSSWTLFYLWEPGYNKTSWIAFHRSSANPSNRNAEITSIPLSGLKQRMIGWS